MITPPGAAPGLCLVDALNVAYWCGAAPSLRLPLSLALALRGGGWAVQLVFDASARHRLPTGEQAVYTALLAAPDVALEVPSGRSADGELLKRARASGARIVSRDGFADHRRRYRKLIDDPSRCLGGAVRGDELEVPGLGLTGPLFAEADRAWQLLLTAAATRSPTIVC